MTLTASKIPEPATRPLIATTSYIVRADGDGAVRQVNPTDTFVETFCPLGAFNYEGEEPALSAARHSPPPFDRPQLALVALSRLSVEGVSRRHEAKLSRTVKTTQ
jgi:hypothetical protein